MRTGTTLLYASLIALPILAVPQARADGTVAAAAALLGKTLTGGSPTTLGPVATGQPNQSCGSAAAPNTPGNAVSAPGSAFNPNGQAPSVYAGQQPQNSKNTASVSQYDVACFEQPTKP